MATIADLEIVIGSQTADAEAGIGRVDSKLGDINVSAAAASAALLTVANKGKDMFMGAISSAMDFEAAIVDAQIATNMSTSEIENMVYSLAEAYPVATTEVANLIEELGKLGVANDAMAGVTESVIQLSSALGTDLVPTGESVMQILNSLGLAAEDAGMLTEQLFKVLAAGSLDLDSFMAAWRNIGASVKQAGMSFVDAAGFITILTDAGIKAEVAGNALARLFNALMKPSDELKAMLADLGIQFTDLEGNLLPVKDIILNIMDVWTSLTTAQKLDLAELIGGKEYMNELATLFDQGREKFQAFLEKYESAMSLKDAMAAKMSTAKAMWDTFMETVDNVQIVIGQKLLPAFKGVLEFLTPLISSIKNVSPAVLQAVTIIGLLVTAFAGLAGAIGMMQTFGAFSGMLMLLTNPVFLVIAGITTLAAALGFLYGKWAPVTSAVNEFMNGFREFGKNFTTNNPITTFLYSLSAGLKAINGDGTPAFLVKLAFAFDALGTKISRMVATFNDFRTQGLSPVQAAMATFSAHFPQAAAVINTVVTALRAGVSIFTSIAVAVGKFVIAALKMGAVRDILVGVVAGFLAFKTITGIIGIFNGIKTAIMGLRVAMLALNTALLANPFVLIAAAVIGLGVAIYLLYKRFAAVRKVVDAILSPFKKLASLVADLAKDVGGKLANAWDDLMDALEPVFNVLRTIASLVGGALMSGLRSLGSVLGTVVSWFGMLAGIVGGALWSALSTVGSFLGGVLVAAFNAVASAIGTVVGWISDLVGWFMNLSTVKDIISDISQVFSGLKDAFSALMDLDIGGFFSGIGTALSGVAETIVNSFTAVPRLLMDMFTGIDWGSLGSGILSGIQGALSGLSSLGSTIMGWITSAASSIDWSALLSGAGDIVSGLSSRLGDLAAWAVQWVQDAAAGINWSDLVSTASNIVNGLSSKLGDLGAWAMKWISDAASALNWSNLLSTATDIVTGLSGRLGDLAAWARKWISDAASAINWSSLIEGATNIVTGLSSKLGDLAAWARKWISDAASAINWSSLLDGASNIVNGLSGKLGDLGAWAVKWITDAAPSIDEWKGLLSNAGDILSGIGTTLGNLGTAMTDWLDTAWTTVEGWFADAAGALGTLWDNLWSGIFGSGGDTAVDGVSGPVQEGLDNASGGWDASPLANKIAEAIGNALAANDGTAIADGFELLLEKGVSVIGEDTRYVDAAAKAVAESFNTAIKGQFEDSFTGESLAQGIEHWFWKAGDAMGASLDDDAHKIAESFDTSMNTALTKTFTGESLSRSIGQWITKAAAAASTTFVEPAMSIARALDTAINVAMTTGMSGQSLATSLQAWISKATAAMNTGGAAMAVGMAIARSLDTGINQAIVTGMSGESLAASLQAWIGKATAAMNAGGASLEVGLAIARSIDTATNTGLSALSGESLSAGVVAWVGRAMTTVGASLLTMGTAFGTLVNAAFVAGIGTLSGGSLGAALNTWISAAFVTSQTSIITFVSQSIALLGGWAVGVTTNVTNTMNTFKSQLSSGTSTGKQSMITFVADTIGVMGGWSGGIKSNVTSTMSTFRSTISTGTSQGKQSFVTFGSDSRSAVTTAMSGITSSARSGMSNLVSAVRSGMSDASSAIRSGGSGWAGIVSGFAGAMSGAGRAVGAAAGEGVAAGLRGAVGSVQAAANAIIAAVDSAMRAKARIASPSKMTRYLGEMIAEGLVVGMERMMGEVSRTGQELALASVTEPTNGSMSARYGGYDPVTSASLASSGRNSGAPNQNVTYVTQNNTVKVTLDDLEQYKAASEFFNDLGVEYELMFTK